MKKQSLNGHFLAELTRLRSLHHRHDVARSLTDGIHDFPLEKRGSIADVVRQLENVEQCLKQLGGNHASGRPILSGVREDGTDPEWGWIQQVDRACSAFLLKGGILYREEDL